MVPCPCKDCKKRNAYCHSACEAFQRFHEERIKEGRYNWSKSESAKCTQAKHDRYKYLWTKNGRRQT